MRIARTDTRGSRRVSTAALCGTTAIAIIGGSLLSASAANAATYSCTTTTGGTQLVDFSGAGGALINTGSSNGLVGIATGSNGVQVGLVNCTAVASIGGTAVSTILTATPTVPITTAPAPTPTPTTTPTGTTPTSSSPTTTPTGTTPTKATPTTAPTTPATDSKKVASIKVLRSATTVYPAKDGYKDKVTFSIKGLTASAAGVKITGKAVLRKGTKVAKTWKISSATSSISWNGRIGKKVVPGSYTLTVTAVSPDGTKKTSKMKVQVSGKHLVSRTVTVASSVKGTDTVAMAPKKVLKALKLGKAFVQVRTVAKVTGPATLVFVNKGVRASIPLVNGVYTTKQLPVPANFAKVNLLHQWKKGDAKLISLRAIWSYKKLV